MKKLLLLILVLLLMFMSAAVCVSADYDYEYHDDYSYEDYGTEPADIKTRVLVSLGIGALIALIMTLVMKSQLKSVRACDTAHEYVVENSFELREKSDIFLYSNVTRVAKPKDNNSSGSRHRK